ncbi:CotH kinase family protein [Myxococcus sp. RHSTA-1-4]|uniref:CotH kinase family protein n=1 Tax=Myxococcus sp. RHSTA-1-4 TaxID=2874601 RepID=UPI001CBB275C|nr:CotH kinase family protein [Myxococcus sp. RHSTA-1-4]MBZ4417906.1 CotH kinase family protein [Myxococcus sp. RHSTA-1-4]
MGRGAGWRVVGLVGLVGLLACGPGATDELQEAISDEDDVHQGIPPRPPGGGSADDADPVSGEEDAGTPPEAPDGGPPPGAGDGPDAGSGGPAPDAGPPRMGEFPPVQSHVPTFALELAPSDLAKLEAAPAANVYVPCTVTLEGVRVKGRMRYRGASTRDLPQKSYKLELAPGQELGDRNHFELLASWLDGGKLTEKFAVDLYRAMGLPAPKARYARVSVNGEPQGLYLDMEHVGKDWLKHHGRERDASIYRCGHRNCELTPRPGSYQSNFEKKTNETTGREDLTAFLAWVNRSDDARFEEELERRVDVEAYLGNLAADALISNNLIEDSRSFWVHELHADRWTYVPWDLNNARMFYWRTWNPESRPVVDRWPQSFTLYDPAVQDLFEMRVVTRPEQRPTWSVLATRVWDRPALRARVIAKLEEALAGPFSEDKALAHIDALWTVVEPELKDDPHASAEHVRRAREFLRGYVRGRRAYLLKELKTLEAHGDGPLVIREVAAGGSGYVELYNRGSGTLRLEDYEVTNDLRATERYRLRPGTLGPGQAVRLLASGDTSRGPLHLPFTLSRNGGEVGVFGRERRSAGTGKPVLYGPEDAIWYGPSSRAPTLP